jgi:hypothetical protein
MQSNNRWFGGALGATRKAVVLITAALQLSACQQKSEAPTPIVPTTRGEYAGPAIHRVRLTAKRAEELGIKTARVREEQISGTLRKVVPAAAVVHDQQGNAWMFKNTDSLVFVRERISVDNIAGDLAVLAEGPAAGTAIVAAGATQLFNDAFNETREGIAESQAPEGDEEKKSSGTVTMLENGNLRVVHKAAGASGLTASVVIEYKPTDEEYQKIIAQVGGLKVGETKAVPSLKAE